MRLLFKISSRFIENVKRDSNKIHKFSFLCSDVCWLVGLCESAYVGAICSQHELMCSSIFVCMLMLMIMLKSDEGHKWNWSMAEQKKVFFSGFCFSFDFGTHTHTVEMETRRISYLCAWISIKSKRIFMSRTKHSKSFLGSWRMGRKKKVQHTLES